MALCRAGSQRPSAQSPPTMQEVKMPINSLPSKEKGWNQGATDTTGPKPGDFPIGSLESRAAARATVEHAKKHNDELSPEDQDALTLYCGAPLLTSGMSPSYPELEAT